MSEAAAQLARLRAHIEGRQALPVDLGHWVLEQIARSVGAATLRDRRDAHLRAAGALIGGSIYRRAREIEVQAALLRRFRPAHLQNLVPGSVHSEILAAQRFGALPRDRQLRAILRPDPWQSND